MADSVNETASVRGSTNVGITSDATTVADHRSISAEMKKVGAAQVADVALRAAGNLDSVAPSNRVGMRSDIVEMMTSARDPAAVRSSLGKLSNSEMSGLLSDLDSPSYAFGDRVAPAAWEGLSKQLGDRFGAGTQGVVNHLRGKSSDLRAALPSDLLEVSNQAMRFDSLGGHNFHSYENKQFRDMAKSDADLTRMRSTNPTDVAYAKDYARSIDETNRGRARNDPATMSNRDLLRAESSLTNSAAVTDAAMSVTGAGNVRHVADVWNKQDRTKLDYVTAGVAAVTAPFGVAASAITSVADTMADGKVREVRGEIDRRIANGALPASARAWGEPRQGPVLADAINVGALVAGGAGVVKMAGKLGKRADDIPVPYQQRTLDQMVAPTDPLKLPPAGTLPNRGELIGQGETVRAYRGGDGNTVIKEVRDSIHGIPLSQAQRATLAERTVEQHRLLRERGFPVPESWVAEPGVIVQGRAQGLRFEELAPDAKRRAVDNRLDMVSLAERDRSVAIDRGDPKNPNANFRFDADGRIAAWFDPAIPYDAPDLRGLQLQLWAR